MIDGISEGFAKRMLMAGFTTVRSLGGSIVNIFLRNAINKGLTKGPRIQVRLGMIKTKSKNFKPYQIDMETGELYQSLAILL